ncbi:MAG: hypothetical protein LBN99_02055 [Oscillospiraceae bacterium]|jgi:hypothetical protein|nr:hypothetical protein [Oscillospiraceae bacterium]
MADRVSVQDVGSLESFGSRLIGFKEEIEALANAIVSATESQNGNWNDPQYESLRDSIAQFSSAVKHVAAELDGKSAYIAHYVDGLRNM